MKKFITSVLFLTALTLTGSNVSPDRYIEASVSYDSTNVQKFEFGYADPVDFGFDTAVLNNADSVAALNASFRSFVVIKDNAIVFEKYYNGHSAYKRNNIKSSTKSITSILIGILIDKGYINSVDQTLGELFPEYASLPGLEEKAGITLRSVLTMTAGLGWSNDNEDGVKNVWWNHSNPTMYAMQVSPVLHPQGKVYNYNSALSHLLSALIVYKTKMTVEEFAKQHLFNPLGITEYYWDADNSGIHRGHSELYLNTHDMAKIGVLYLRNGNWFGKQIVSKEWVKESVKPHVMTPESSRRLYGYYGYQWWSRNIGGFNTYFTSGYGGQYIYVIPQKNVIVVTTARWDNTLASRMPLKLMEEYVVKAMK